MSIRRREFGKATAAALALALTGCGGGGGAAPAAAPVPESGPVPPAPPPPAPSPSPSPAPSPGAPALGVNLVGLQIAGDNLRASPNQVNVNFEPPRKAGVAWLASQGFTRNRLPLTWELLQPVLFDTNINAATRAVLGNPGEFDPLYQSYITAVLDAHAAVGSKCFLDLHNYGRYLDFRYQPDGSVIGLVKPADPTVPAYTSDRSQLYTRIFATAPGATLATRHFTDFWTRAARIWGGHPGLGGYGLMNEPHDLPARGSITESAGDEDLFVWPAFAQAAIDAIRAIDPVTPIYLDGNQWSAAFSMADRNPAWPARGTNVVYSVHMYLDAGSTGQRFDFDSEVAMGLSAGFGAVPLNLDMGWQRLKVAVDWAAAHGVKLALSETGMPLDDPRWQEMFQRLSDYARANGVELYAWNGGDYWMQTNSAINFVPGWHQGRTLEPPMAGVLKKSWDIPKATLFDDGPGYALAGTPVTITVYARGYLASPLTLAIRSDNGGTLSASTVTLPEGANPQATYTFTPAADRVTTLTYTVHGPLQSPPPRKVYSLVDPVSYAATDLAEAARALVAKYGACKWEAADAYTDYVDGAPAQSGQPVRAIADSGYGSSVGNAMEMINWMNTDAAATANFPPAVMKVAAGRKCIDHSGWSTSGLWCRKSVPQAQVQPHPRNVVPYTIADPHFTIAAVSANPGGTDGVIFQASKTSHLFASQLGLAGGRPQAICADETGASVTLSAPDALASGAPVVLAFTSMPGAQRLRVNSSVVASASASFAPSVCDQMMIGWGFQGYYPRPGFGGNLYAVITGKGSPTAAELQVMERYLAATAGAPA
jgi:hypothetical protein